jgi:hypothetical protein
MAHSTPDALWSRADAKRATAAAGAFTVECAVLDPRVEGHYHVWRDAHVQAIADLRARVDQEDAPTRAEAQAVADQFHQERFALLQAFVRAELLARLPPTWAGSVTGWLTDLFRVRSYNHRHPNAPRLFFGIPIAHLTGEQGKMPARDAEDIARNARWVCQHYVLEARVSKHALAKRHGCTRSAVQNGLKQGWALLDLAARGAVLVPPEKKSPPS